MWLLFFETSVDLNCHVASPRLNCPGLNGEREISENAVKEVQLFNVDHRRQCQRGKKGKIDWNVFENNIEII